MIRTAPGSRSDSLQRSPKPRRRLILPALQTSDQILSVVDCLQIGNTWHFKRLSYKPKCTKSFAPGPRLGDHDAFRTPIVGSFVSPTHCWMQTDATAVKMMLFNSCLSLYVVVCIYIFKDTILKLRLGYMTLKIGPISERSVNFAFDGRRKGCLTLT